MYSINLDVLQHEHLDNNINHIANRKNLKEKYPNISARRCKRRRLYASMGSNSRTPSELQASIVLISILNKSTPYGLLHITSVNLNPYNKL